VVIKPHRFGVDGNITSNVFYAWQIVLMIKVSDKILVNLY
jgi:hypothetical protein